MTVEYLNLYFVSLAVDATISADFPLSQHALQQHTKHPGTQEAVWDSSCASSESAKWSVAVEGQIWSILRF